MRKLKPLSLPSRLYSRLDGKPIASIDRPSILHDPVVCANVKFTAACE
jgi:hypothetical protein